MIAVHLSSSCAIHLLLSIAYGKDWRKIAVYDSEVVPSLVRIFEGTPVIAYCGSSLPVIWTYERFCINQTIILTTDPVNSAEGFTYRLQTNNILLKNLRAFDTGLFTCYGTYITPSYEAAPFSSGVSVYVERLIDRAPDCVVIPNFIQVTEGDCVTLTCKSDKPVEWFGASLKYIDSTVYNNSIELRNLKKEHSGLYFCRGIYSNFNVDGYSRIFRLFHSRARIVIDGYTHSLHSRNLSVQREMYLNNF